MKKKFVDFFMGVAENAATLSYAERRKVGCVIVKDGNILSFGYNGTPNGWDNCCEYRVYYNRLDKSHHLCDFPYSDTFERCYKLVTDPSVSHAEENAIAKLASSNQSSEGAIAFVTLAPCIHCAKLLKNAKISEVIYKDDYATDGIEFLLKCGVLVTKWQKLEIG